MRSSVSARMRAISALDHSRTPAMSSSAIWRSSVTSSAERLWTPSTWFLASTRNSSSVLSRCFSSSARMARTSSVTKRAPALCVATAAGIGAGAGAAGCSSAGATCSASPPSAGAWVGSAVAMLISAPSWSTCGEPSSGFVSASGVSVDAEPPQGRRKPAFCSVEAIGHDPRCRGGSVWSDDSVMLGRWSEHAEAARGTNSSRRWYRNAPLPHCTAHASGVAPIHPRAGGAPPVAHAGDAPAGRGSSDRGARTIGP